MKSTDPTQIPLLKNLRLIATSWWIKIW
jgi:hypothetical protein